MEGRLDLKESPIRTERKTIHLPPDTIQALNKLAARNGTDFSKEVRRAIDEYLDLETTAENIDMINGVIRQELSGQLKALGNRLAGLINRLTIISLRAIMPTLPLLQTSLTKIAIRLLKKLSRRPESGHWHLPIRKTRMRCVLSWMTRKCRKPSMPYKEVPVSILIYKQRHRHPNYKKLQRQLCHIGYIATRPGAVKNEGMRHGLFGKLEPGAVKEFDTWQEAARLVRELSYRRVNM